MSTLLRILAAAMLLLGGAGAALAQTNSGAAASAGGSTLFSFPIVELGNCDSKEACKLYCDALSHRDACFAFAQKVGLLSKEQVAAAKVVLNKKGPGGCDSRDSCQAYCSQTSHLSECRVFAEQNGLAPKAASSTPGMMKPRPASTTAPMPPKERMGSTSPMMMPKTGSSTPGLRAEMEAKARMQNASSTAPKIKNEPVRKVGTSSPATTGGDTRPPGLNSKIVPPPPGFPSKNDNIGAAVVRGFLHLIGF